MPTCPVILDAEEISKTGLLVGIFNYRVQFSTMAEKTNAAIVQSAIDTLSPADLMRLKSFARKRATIIGKGHDLDYIDELAATAIEKALDGTRNWNPTKVNFFGFLVGIIKSETSHAAERFAAHPEFISADVPESYQAHNETSGESYNSVEDFYDGKVLLAKIKKHFENDQICFEVICLEMEGYSGKEVAEKLNIDYKGYDAARKRISRDVQELAEILHAK
jgi:DNA-directed RNA polymerase specialized sigma24 family protein